jgi:hypothetical protein
VHCRIGAGHDLVSRAARHVDGLPDPGVDVVPGCAGASLKPELPACLDHRGGERSQLLFDLDDLCNEGRVVAHGAGEIGSHRRLIGFSS